MEPCRWRLDITLEGLALWHPAGRRFWQRHGLIRMPPPQGERAGDSSAAVVRLESVASAARMEVVFATESYAVRDVHGDAGG